VTSWGLCVPDTEDSASLILKAILAGLCSDAFLSPMNVVHDLKKSYGRREVVERFVQGNCRAGLKRLHPLPLLTSKVVVTLLHVGKNLILSQGLGRDLSKFLVFSGAHM